MAFNRFFVESIEKFGRENIESWDDGGTNEELSDKERAVCKLVETYYKAYTKGAMFDVIFGKCLAHWDAIFHRVMTFARLRFFSHYEMDPLV